MRKVNSISVIIPAVNEEQNIKKCLKEILDFVPQISQKYEVIIVDDGSTDETLIEAKKIKNPFLKVLVHQKNYGKGKAIKTGLMEAKGEYCFFTDADHQCDIENLKNFITFTDKYQAVIGVRTGREMTASRLVVSKVNKFLNKLLFGISVSDVNCPFKLFKTEFLNPKDLISKTFFIDSEVIYLLNKNSAKIKEINVLSKARKYGKSKVNIRTTLLTVFEMVGYKLKLI